MKEIKICAFFILAFNPLFLYIPQLTAQIYKDPKYGIEMRLDDLIKRMTLEEKIRQMSMHSFEGFRKESIAYGVVESPFIHAKEVAKQSYYTKSYAQKSTRLGIPPIQIAECLHGLLAFGATIFPQAINQGSTWNSKLIEEMGKAIAKEAE
ncbi:MAG: hypothetical protein LBF27_08895 [Sphingobacterium sp.]|jgi:beta-glucosidase|nr:hypothetical protein [Sphingobacterium sp.]